MKKKYILSEVGKGDNERKSKNGRGFGRREGGRGGWIVYSSRYEWLMSTCGVVRI